MTQFQTMAASGSCIEFPTNNIAEIVLDRVESYDASTLDCYAFRRSTDIRNGYPLALGNMVGGFEFCFHGIKFATSEAAYICGCFSSASTEHIAIQQQLVGCANGLLAKRAIRRQNSPLIRPNWEEFNIEWMLYVVWHKVIGNDRFRNLLLQLPADATIIEDSTFHVGRTAQIWGAQNQLLRSLTKQYKTELRHGGMKTTQIRKECDLKRLGEWSHQGVYEGKNLMGKILTLCARALRNGSSPGIDYQLLRSMKIHLLGKELTFEDETPITKATS